MKKKKWIKFEIESVKGTSIDLSEYFKSATVYNSNGDEIDRVFSERYIKELDKKYEKILAEIVKNG